MPADATPRSAGPPASASVLASGARAAHGRLPFLVRAGYGAGDFAVNLFFQSALLFLLFFYTDVAGIAAATAASIFLVARIVDAVTDPVMGIIADRTRTRWGRFRPYVLLGGPLLALMGVATFSAPDLSPTGKVVYAYVSYILFGIAYTVVSIPYSSLTSALTEDAHERTVLSTYRMAFAMLGGLLVAAATVPLVQSFGGGAGGYQTTLAIYGVLACVLLTVTFAATRERQFAHEDVPRLRQTGQALKAGGWPLALLIFAFWMGMMAFTVRQTAIIYYFTYNVARTDLIALFMLTVALFNFIGIILVPPIAKRMGKRKTYLAGAFGGCVAGIALYLTPTDQVALIFLVSWVGSIMFAAPTVMGWSMLPDAVDYAELRSGVRADGAIYAATSFFQKMAMALGGAGAALILAATGYVPNAPQTPEALGGILFMVALGPVLLFVLGAAAMLFYPLTDEKFTDVTTALAEQRAARADA